MNYLSDRVLRMQESKTILMSRLTRELRAQGREVYSLSLGDLDFDTPEYIREAAKLAIDENYSHYPPVEGYPDLLDAIIDKFEGQTGFRYERKNILVSNGAKHTLANIILSLVNPGDEVILPLPYWVTYNELINLAGGRQIYLRTELEDEFKVRPERLEAAISERTKLIILNNPNNPTGAVYSYDELRALVDVLERYPHVIVVSDEVYDRLVYEVDFVSMGLFENIRDRLVLVNGVSKTYAMTGWRIGFMAAPQWLVSACKKLQGQMTSGANAIAQRAALSALRGGEEIIRQRREILRRRRDLMVSYLQEIPNVRFMTTQGSFYIFPLFDKYFGKSYGEYIINSSEDLAVYLLKEAGVALVAGEAFGYGQAMRLSFATDEQVIRTAMERIITALQKLK